MNFYEQVFPEVAKMLVTSKNFPECIFQEKLGVRLGKANCWWELKLHSGKSYS